MRIWHRTVACAILRRPLMRTGRALRQFPFVGEQVREEVVAPLRRRGRPNDFQATTNCVSTKTLAKLVLPPEALIFDGCAFWFGAYILSGNGSAVRFAEGVTPGNERDSLLVIHRHAGKSLPDIPCRGDRIRLSIWPFRIHIDQTHLHGRERILKITVAAVAFVRQPLALRPPENVFFGFPDVLTPAAKTERLKAHRLQGNVACENHQVGPGDLPPILLLDRPQQPARLVEVHVVGPAIERSETLLPSSGPAAAVTDAVRARAVPRHTNEKWPIMAKIGRPPILRVRHQGMQV